MSDPRPIKERINQQLESLIIEPTIREEAVKRMMVIASDVKENTVYAFTSHRYEGKRVEDIISQIDFIAAVLRKGTLV